MVDENHKNEPTSPNSEELFGGEPIISEFGEQYRCQYMKDEQTTGGFCVLSPTQLRMGGLHKVNLVFGIWLPSKGHKVYQDGYCKYHYAIHYVDDTAKSAFDTIFGD